MSEKASRLNGYLRYMKVLEKSSSKVVASKAVAPDTVSVTVTVSCYQFTYIFLICEEIKIC